MRHLKNIWSFSLPAVLWLDAAAVFAETSFSLGAGLLPDGAGKIMSAASAAAAACIFPLPGNGRASGVPSEGGDYHS